MKSSSVTIQMKAHYLLLRNAVIISNLHTNSQFDLYA